ncbi:MAG TPA: methyltransferase [Beutenbergiaceae bacterium]|nr:methyltransferase [Beutenbergiaceae bacterium]
MAPDPRPLPPPPDPGPGLIARLRADLSAARYTVAHLADLLGPVAVAALDREEPLPARLAARASDDPAAVLTLLFALGEPVTRSQVDRALPGVGADGATRLGLVRAAGTGRADEVQALLDLRPVGAGPVELWLASDLGEAVTGAALDPGHVLGVGGAGRTLAELTIRTPVARALDLGTGSGIQALNVAEFAGSVTGTDISERALRFAAFNAALNELSVDLRSGDGLGPVAGERFDLIVSNPPFVITPRSAAPTITYRDGGRRGDDFVAALVRALPEHLAPGGVAQLLANWEIPEGADWTERVEDWTAALGTDVWVIQREMTDPARYAETWLRDGGLSPERDRDAWERAYRAYLDDFASRGVEAIGFGYITLRRPATERPPWRRLEDLTAPLPPAPGAALAATLDAVEVVRHGRPGSGEDFLERAYVVPEHVTEERHYRPGQPHPEVILLHQGGGLGRRVQVTSHTAALVGACDGDLTAAQIIAALGVLSDEPVEQIRDEVAPAFRGLYLDGFVHPSG